MSPPIAPLPIKFALKGAIPPTLRTTGLESDSARNNNNPNNKKKPEIQTKTPEKQHVNMASQAECERCFETYVVISTYIFRCSG